MAVEPSPTAEATRFMLPPRTSPTANTPGRLVSSRYGGRARGQRAAARSSAERSGPVLMKPLASRATQFLSQGVLGSAPVITNTCPQGRDSVSSRPWSRHSTPCPAGPPPRPPPARVPPLHRPQPGVPLHADDLRSRPHLDVRGALD